jgi:hypothetical protein
LGVPIHFKPGLYFSSSFFFKFTTNKTSHPIAFDESIIRSLVGGFGSLSEGEKCPYFLLPYILWQLLQQQIFFQLHPCAYIGRIANNEKVIV